MRFTTAFLLSLTIANAWVLPNRPLARSCRTLHMALDYNDPAVAEELANVQTMSFEEVEEELLQSGVRGSPTMNDMELKLMLVEVRMQMSGKVEEEKKEKKTSFSSKFEEALYTKPAFEEFYNKYKDKGDHNSMNVLAEFVNTPDIAEQRYGKDYKGLLRRAKEAITAPPPVKSPTLQFSGFPANMGEAGCKMTLEAVGTITDFECSESEDFPILTGKVTFEDIETAKKAVEQYNGMDMGMGTALELSSA
uniref:RRM domain-containing protein n=1 Tax=Thalassionema nitzschioides TaxID=33649 RepID=A0A6T5Z1Y3_9STRA|mmetsp:Transcript_25580/g.37785  ORF Transcript_25580/g.37785 Transcript_25580/m.37785 type:complete len:250 (-) Transcript_25580:160-909(-)|eukprot:CAMPEP_0194203224 /NCGR_PEP_ID=MMETSP0156-20130528/3065_1 /TAXON_ID=33649 /ORGANISM="Thalassionema nitzschioides, Strain L26-B" /LENGTH=249 /DNA_ID=CAMNT_0038928931 /DNA_START=125 /DNA_END=874 /DNA_ORIENTATION=-